ncbi:intermembrane lipid transfer protein VPS13D-like isoform X2 [Clavelina lepadiformis]|uniref:intermembrane lipid transfer protein VPS13D-like isoform X2 n=1 Tax=Clavelina lepadiformis TaxID=159417 RepID=UPI0040435998
MLERFGSQFLNRYIGKYFENFNKENLSIGILQGAVELEGLHLRKDALKEFDLPGIEVTWGYVGKISIRIPSYKSYSEPWVVEINKLYLIASPSKNHHNKDDDNTQKERLKERKLRQLAELEERWRASQGTSKSIYSIGLSYFSSIATNIFEKLQVRVFDVHVRYEDDTTLPEDFSCGFHVDVLSAQSTNENWEPISTSEKCAERKWKKIRLSKASFYWDAKSIIFSNLSHDDIVGAMATRSKGAAKIGSLLRGDHQTTGENNMHEYMLCPVSGEARFTQACSQLPLRSRNCPRFTLDVELPSIPLQINKLQYNQVVALATEIARWDNRMTKAGKPTIPVKENPAVWWKWAMNTHIERVKRKQQRQTLKFVLKRAKLLTTYVKTYHRYLNERYVTKTQINDVPSIVQQMDSELTFDELRVFRELVYDKMDKETRKKQETEQNCNVQGASAKSEKSWRGWKWGGWFGWRSPQPQTHSLDTGPSNKSSFASTEIKPAEKVFLAHENIYKDLDEDEFDEIFGKELLSEETTDTFLRRDTVLLRLNFILKKGTFKLTNVCTDQTTQADLLNLEFNTVHLASEWRPRSGTHEININLGGVVLKDLDQENKYFCNIIKSSPRPKRKPASPCDVTSQESAMSSFANERVNNLLNGGQCKADSPSFEVKETEHPVLSVTYKKLPQTTSSLFSYSLGIAAAPLSLTFIPGIADRLKTFFKTPKATESEILTKPMKESYEFWMNRAQAEIKTHIWNILEGKEVVEMNRKRWAVSLDIFAPEITIPEDWTDSDCRVVVFNLGHMIFENYDKGEQSRGKQGDKELENYNDDDFFTPPSTPPNEQSNVPERIHSLETNLQEEFVDSTHVFDNVNVQNDTFVPKLQNDRKLNERMYESYYLQLDDLQVQVTPNNGQRQTNTPTDKNPLDIVERFSVTLLADKRIVSTRDPRLPAIVLSGNLPHLKLHFSHDKLHTVMKCMEVLGNQSPETSSSLSSPTNTSGVQRKSSVETFENSDLNEGDDWSKPFSTQLCCDFLVKEISVFLEDTDKEPLSVLEVKQIHTRFIKRPYDTTASLSVYSLVLVDLMQQLGPDFKFLLSSHESALTDVGCGTILGSRSSSSAIPFKRCASTTTRSHSLNTSTTNTVRNTEAEKPQEFTSFGDRQTDLNLSGTNFAEDITLTDDATNSSSMGENLITLELKSMRRHSPDLYELSVHTETKTRLVALNTRKVINANFNKLDVVYNACSWVTLLTFLHKLKLPTSSKLRSENSKYPEANESVGDSQLNDVPVITQEQIDINAQDVNETQMSINFQQVNVLLLRHVYGPHSVIGRPIVTVTTQGTKIDAELGKLSQNVEDSGYLNVTGSVASLQIHDLSTGSTGLNNLQALTVLSIGTNELDISGEAEAGRERVHAAKLLEKSDAFSLDFQKCSVRAAAPSKDKSLSASKSRASFSDKNHDNGNIHGTHVSDTMLSDMKADDQKDSSITQTGTESKLHVELASACYIHAPRMIAELLALYDETDDIITSQMTNATIRAYKDLASNIMNNASEYGMAFLSKSMADNVVTNEASFTPKKASQAFNAKQTKSVQEKFRLFFQVQTPIVAFPKCPGSFELLVANLGQITIENDQEISRGLGPLDKFNIQVVNISLRSHRQRKVEMAAKMAEKEQLKHKVSSQKIGPSISELKRDNFRFLNVTINEEDLSGSQQRSSDVQILHKTSLQLTIIRKPYIPSTKSSLDVRKCCKKYTFEKCSENSRCPCFISHVGVVSDKQMCVTVFAASPLSVALSKPVYEQVLKTLRHISHNGDIDCNERYENAISINSSNDGRKPTHFESATSFVEVPRNQHQFGSRTQDSNLVETRQSRNKSGPKIPRSSTSSHQSTSLTGMEQVSSQITGLENTVHDYSQNAQNSSMKTFTPISADFSVPCLIFQLNGDINDEKQGILKVTMEKFNGAYETENRFGTSLNFSIGNLDVEDLKQEETSPIRHIVVSCFPEDNSNDECPSQTDFLSTVCSSGLALPLVPQKSQSTSHFTAKNHSSQAVTSLAANRTTIDVFRPFESLYLSPDLQTQSGSAINHDAVCEEDVEKTLVRIRAFLVDDKSAAYRDVYDNVNRRVTIDFNFLDCKVNLQTWVVLLDFFSIGTSPEKADRADAETEEKFPWDKQMDIQSFYENQPDAFINSEVDFNVHSFSLTFNKPEYKLLKARVAGLQSSVKIRDETVRVFGHLGNLEVSDLSPNGSLYRERFIFTGEKALDFEIWRHHQYDEDLLRDFDISVKLRMSSIRYVHTMRFQHETVAYCQHFQLLQEVLGRMRASSIGQNVRTTSRRQARVLLNIEADAPVILIPESSHADRLLVANLGHITVQNEFLRNGQPGTLSYINGNTDIRGEVEQTHFDRLNSATQLPSNSPRGCLLDVIRVDLIDMGLYTATYTRNTYESSIPSRVDKTKLTFPSYTVTCHARPMLKEKVKLKLQMELNLEKEITHRGAPDLALSVHLSSVYCYMDHTQYWLIRSILDHNAGELIPDFPQPNFTSQPSTPQAEVTGDVYIKLSMDFCLSNVSIELLEKHGTNTESRKSLGRLDFLQSLLSYRKRSDNMDTTNLSCQAFRGVDTRFEDGFPAEHGKPPNIFTSVLGAMEDTEQPTSSKYSRLEFEIFLRNGPGFMELTTLLNNMRVYVIIDWLLAMNKYLMQNPDQKIWNSLKAKTVQLMKKYGQIEFENQRGLDSSSQLEPEIKSTDIKFNSTNTKFVVVQDSSRMDSDALILRSTAMLRYSQDENQPSITPNARPLTCSLQGLEVFSCQLDKEHETSLSIIDPVDVNFQVRPVKQADLSEEDIESNLAVLEKNILEIYLTDLNMRVSYNDLMLFLDIFKSFSSQAGLETTGKPHPPKSNLPQNPAALSQMKAIYKPNPDSVQRLIEMGFSKRDVIHALTVNGGGVRESGSWLVEHCTSQSIVKTSDIMSPAKKQVPLNISRVNFSVDVMKICLIDDCAQNCDVPLTEIALRNLCIRQAIADSTSISPLEVLHEQTGSTSFSLSGDYYNRILSLWEPFLEPWRCSISWNHEVASSNASGKWNFKLDSLERMDISVTSTLVKTMKKTFATWRKDYQDSRKPMTSPVTRRRQPLVPYLLRNLTGTTLYFTTQTSPLEGVSALTCEETSLKLQEWKEVLPGEQHPFNFSTNREKQRHKRSETPTLHQVSVKIGNWKTLKPITVGKVGTYFQHATMDIAKRSALNEPLLPIRVVFHVAMQDNAQKVVTIRSSLAVQSRVKVPVQLQLNIHSNAMVTLPILEPNETQYIPVSLVQSSLRIRPQHNTSGSFQFCKSMIRWQHMRADKDEESCLVECTPTYGGLETNRPFYFAICIRRQPYPTYEETCQILKEHRESEQLSESGWEHSIPQLPGHTIIILPPVVISNLLPCELDYYMKNPNVKGTLKPGVDAMSHEVLVFQANAVQPSLIFGCLPENFKTYVQVVVPSVVKNSEEKVLVKDFRNEALLLKIRILWRLKCSVKISVMACWWIVNETGFPIVVKQDGCTNIAAGQYDEHEVSNSMRPLMFSYANKENPHLCTMRLGNQSILDQVGTFAVHFRGFPTFCERFSTDGGSCTRSLKMLSNSIDRDFFVGISVQRGWGRYLHTKIVTLSPRFRLFNKTCSRRLSFSQKIRDTSNLGGAFSHLTIASESSCVFHWPRVDLDNLLCVRLADEPYCHWSGGFSINKTNSFQVALRLNPTAHHPSVKQLNSFRPQCIFLHIEVTLVKATYCVSVSDVDPDIVPSPLRIDNLSSVPITFKQAGTNESYNSEVHAENQLAYAFDEPCLPQAIDCNVSEASNSVTMDMTCVGLETQLFYETYFYITLGASPNLLSTMDPLTHDREVLVFDIQAVQQSHYVTLQPLRSGKCSQLWRMSSDGRLHHKGSSFSKGISSKKCESNKSSPTDFVLDVAKTATNQSRAPVQEHFLIILPPDEGRTSTQTWQFCDDGRLKCRHLKDLCVHAKSLTLGSPVVLASYDERRFCSTNEVCSHHKQTPGSGVLSLKVIRDGPTRVLQILDIRQKQAELFEKQTGGNSQKYSAQSTKPADDRGPLFFATLSMPKGLGISLINNIPEELLYWTLNGVHLSVSGSDAEQIFSLRVQTMQIDNQLLDGRPTVLLSPGRTSSSKGSSSERFIKKPRSFTRNPLISVNAIRQPWKSKMYDIFKLLEINFGELFIAVEESLMLKLFHFIDYDLASSQREIELLTETRVDFDLTTRKVNRKNNSISKRLYFDALNISVAPLRLSVLTASNVPSELQALKRTLTFPLVSFEKAPVSIQAYRRSHLQETISFLFADLSKHLRNQLKGQAAIILGSVDFLGNPIGLLNDVRDAVVSGVESGNIRDIFKDITHGISKSSVKITSSLSAGLGQISMDQEYKDKRRAIQAKANSHPGSHVVAGLQGFMAGAVGGLTGIVTQPIKGAKSEGAKGFFTGIGKGLLGTVTKPVTGVLDLASGSASAIREISTSTDRVVERIRQVRCCHNLQGCLQPYSKTQADGQTFLYKLNKNDHSEHFYSVTRVQQNDDMQILITNKKLYVIKGNEPEFTHVKVVVYYPHLINVKVLTDPDLSPSNPFQTGCDRPRLELTIKLVSPNDRMYDQVKRMTVPCHNLNIAEYVCSQINHAKTLASQQRETLLCGPDEEDAKERAFDLEV